LVFASLSGAQTTDAPSPLSAASNLTTQAPEDTTATAQEANAGSEDTGPGGGGRLGALPAVSDSLALAQSRAMLTAPSSGFDWLESFDPTASADIESNVQQVVARGQLSAQARWLDGGNSTVRYGLRNTSYRQQDRDQQNQDILATFAHELGGMASLNLSLSGNISLDENRLSNGETVSVDYMATDANLTLDGGQELTDEFGHHWSVRGRLEDVEQDNRGTNNDRQLGMGGFTSFWEHVRDGFSLAARLGYDKAGGDRQLRGQTDDATTVQDTLGAQLRIDRGRRLRLDASVDRISFVEERLDFNRNASGVIDTLDVPDDQKVGQERESRATTRFNVAARSNPLRRVSLEAQAGHDLAETQYIFSQQGVIQRGRDSFSLAAGVRYAAAGSLKVSLNYDNNYNDRRALNENEFRGEESRQAREVGMEVVQGVGRDSDLSFKARQALDQNFFEEVTNKNDRDRLIERFDATLRSRAVPRLTANISSTLQATRDVNIASERVGNNKEDRLYEVRGGYIFRPIDNFDFEQSYRLQIVFIDYFNSDDRDQFNKQGQLLNRATWSWSSRGRFSLEYSVDYRQTGKRDPDFEFEEKYFVDQRRFDHQIRANITIPLPLVELTVNTQRGFLREDRTRDRLEEDRGKISMRIAGQREFWNRKAQLRLNVERVLEFGPRVRPENEDYWVANSGLTVRF
jgi:hypothetical protein